MSFRTARTKLCQALFLTGFCAAAPFGFAAGVDIGNLDRSVAPCTDFYRFATGHWADTHPVPADRARWGAFDEVDERNRELLVSILQEAAKANAPAGTPLRKVGDFYSSGMAAQFADAKEGLQAALLVTTSSTYAKSVAGAFALLHAQGAKPGFNFSVEQDPRNASRYIPQFFQGGLGLPDREYYLAKDDKSAKIREAYVAHIARISELLGVDKSFALKGALAILELETALAEAQMTRADARDPDQTYHLMRINDLKTLAPNFDWNEYFATVEIAAPGEINVGQPEYFRAFSKLLKDTPTSVWRDYTSWHTLRAVAPYLGGDIERENFAFYGKILTGAEEMEAREKRVAATIDRVMSDDLGHLFANRALSPAGRKKAQDLVANIRLALRDRIQAVEWMSAATRKEALAKLDATSLKIGYPDTWLDSGAVSIKANDYVGNILNAQRAEFRRQIDRLGKTIDRNLWNLSPPTANAQYNPNLNEIVLPAGILQPPFFDEHADDASNYGGIGMIIGHELTHGFDDRGRKFDSKGNRRDWWTEADAASYLARADAMANLYDGFEPTAGLHVNGRATLGENIADFGGVRLAYLALQKAQQGKSAKPIDGFSADQRYFLSFAQAWRETIRDEEMRRRVLVSVHAPSRFRVLAPLAHSGDFQRAFQCKADDKMMSPADKRIAIW